eukprot:12881704-Prorocentrum_lima.AAC.1
MQQEDQRRGIHGASDPGMAPRINGAETFASARQRPAPRSADVGEAVVASAGSRWQERAGP